MTINDTRYYESDSANANDAKDDPAINHVDAQNVTVDNFSQTSNTQRENKNKILTSEKLDKLDRARTDFTHIYSLSP